MKDSDWRVKAVELSSDNKLLAQRLEGVEKDVNKMAGDVRTVVRLIVVAIIGTVMKYALEGGFIIG